MQGFRFPWLIAMFLAATHARSLDKRSVQTSAICLDEFSWMDNSIAQSPCSVAAWLLSQCAGGNWDLPAIPNNASHYGTPGFGSTATSLCACSWASYNTLQACAFCQGEAFETTIITWDAYNPNCTGNFLTSDSPWPPSVVIPSGTEIPFWAEQNPNDWMNSKFDPIAAQQLALEHKPDLSEANRNKKSKPTAAIAGGVVGGIVGISAIGLLLFKLFWRRKGYKHLSFGTSHRPLRPSHGRSISDESSVKYTEYTTSPSPGIPTTSSILSVSVQRPPFRQQNLNGSTHSIPQAPGQLPMRSVSYTAHSPDFGVRAAAHLGTPAATYNTGVVPVRSSVATAAAAAASSSPSMLGHGHAHTLSNHSNMSTVPPSLHDRAPSQASDYLEGAISPFILPPIEQPATASAMESVPSAADGAAAQSPVSRKAERMNPPAYSPVSSPEERMFGSAAAASPGAQSRSGGTSVDARATADSRGLSGTTLLQNSNSRDATTVGSVVGEGRGEERLSAYFPADRKI